MENSPNYNLNIMISSPSEDAWWQVPYLSSSNTNAFTSAPEVRLYNVNNNTYYGIGQRQQQQNQQYHQPEMLLDIAPSASQDSTTSTEDDGTHHDAVGAQSGHDAVTRKTREPLRDITKACNKRRCRGGDH